MLQKKINIIIKLFVILNLILISFSSFIVNADENNETITFTISVNEPQISINELGHSVYISDFGRNLNPGMPNLPSKIFSIAIPPDAEILNIEVSTPIVIEIEDEIFVEPCEIPNTIGTNTQSDDTTIFDSNYNDIYSSDDAYPQNIVEFERDSKYRKYNMVDIRVNPCTFYPLSQKLQYYPTIEITIKYNKNENVKLIEDNLEETEKIAKTIIFNYDEAQQWYHSSKLNNKGLYDYVIITLDSLTTYITPIVDWEIAKGRNVNVVTTSWIDANYNGYDLAAKIRTFLIEKYPSSQWGIQDLLLIGHYDDVPMRRCAQNMGYGEPETDYYYAELSEPDSQSWDADGDHEYGEDSDPIDFYAEINVGRIPFTNSDTVSHICNKSILYEENEDESFKKNILFLGAYFWPDTDNAELMEEIAAQPHMSDWTKTKMYEQAQSEFTSDYDLNFNNVETVWSSGSYSFVDWAGHGSPTACFEYYPDISFVSTSTSDSLNDEYPSIVFADACSNQDTDSYNIGQSMMKQGAIGFLGATKVAYGKHGWDDPTDGSSQSFDYYFTTKVTSGEYTTGGAHQWAITKMYTDGLWYYDYYETFEWGAYLGNPNINMFLDPPEPILSVSPLSYDFGTMNEGEIDTTTFEIWNSGNSILDYQITAPCNWVDVSPISGNSSGEHDIITIEVDTTGLTEGSHHCDLSITSDGGDETFGVDLYIASNIEELDISQEVMNRAIPIRHATDGDWAAAQNFTPTKNTLNRIELYVRTLGWPDFDLVVELREETPDGPLLDTKTFPSEEISSSWMWLSIDIDDITITQDMKYCITVPSAPTGITNSFGYEWGYGFGDLYGGGSFWFNRLYPDDFWWQALPNKYEYTFKTYGYS